MEELEKKFKNYSYVTKEYLMEKYNRGYGQMQIANDLDCTIETIKRILKKHGVYDLFKKRREEKRKQRLYVIDKNLFIKTIKEASTVAEVQKKLNIDENLFNKYIVKYQLKRAYQDLIDRPKIEELKSKIKDLLSTGHNIQEISDLLNIPTYNVGYFIRKNGIREIKKRNRKKA